MHTDLSSHLHTDECNVLIANLLKCHDDHPFKKFMGHCNNDDVLMRRCLKNERLTRATANRIKSDEMKRRWRMSPEEREKLRKLEESSTNSS